MNQLDWIKVKISENNMDYKSVQSEECYQDYCNTFNSGIAYKSYKDRVKIAYDTLEKQSNDVSEDFEVENSIGLEKRLQRKTDLTTYFRRNNRNSYRLMNEVEAICEELLHRLDEVKFDIPKMPAIKEKKEKKTAILCLSDLHAGTLIEAESEDLCYDYNILSRRLKKYITKSVETMKKNDITNVIVCGLGDFVSSPRRVDELLGQVSSATNSLLIIVTLIEQILFELCSHFEKVTYISVIGNESRVSANGVQSPMNYSHWENMNNWDNLQYIMLKHILDGKIKNLEFLDSDYLTKSLIKIPINNNETYNVCIAHGFSVKNLKDGAEEIYTKSYLEEGEHIELTIIGHYHHLTVLSSGHLLVTGSPMRNNAYAFGVIGTKGHAFQNLVLINNDGSYWSCPIKLDDISDFPEGYNIQKELNMFTYNESRVDKVNISITYN